MIIFPTTESKTNLGLPPWSAIVVSAICIAVHFFVFIPEHAGVEARQRELKAKLIDALDWDVDQGNLSHEASLSIRDNPALLEDAEYRGQISENVKATYRSYSKLDRPMLAETSQSLSAKLRLMFMAHSASFLILTIFFLPFAGFLLEHQYHYIVAAFVYVGTAAAMVFGVSLPNWPAPSMAWSYSLATIVLLALITAPSSVITMTAKGWFFRSFQFQLKVPYVLIASVFGILFYIGQSKWTRYADEFEPTTLWLVPAFAVGWLVVLLIVPSRDRRDEMDSETIINTTLARIEMLYSAEKNSQARAELEAVVAQGPTLDQMMRIGELAWRHNENEIAEKCFASAVRLVMPTKDLARILPVVEEVAFKDKGVAAAALQATIELGIQENHFDHVRKLVPIFKDHPQVDDAQVYNLFKKILDMLLASKDPDQDYMLRIRTWLEPNPAFAGLVEMINQFFGKMAQKSEAVSNYSDVQTIQTHVNIDLQAVTNDHIRLRVEGSNAQDVPWTAIQAVFGGHMISADRGYRGTVILRFKRKTFGCHFTSNQISMTRENGEPLTFEDTWALLRRFAPENLPMMRFRDFRDHLDLSAYQRDLESFFNTRV